LTTAGQGRRPGHRTTWRTPCPPPPAAPPRPPTTSAGPPACGSTPWPAAPVPG